MVRFSAVADDEWRSGVTAATGTALTTGCIIGAACIAVGVCLPPPLSPALVALGLTLPGLLLQDAWRFAFFARRRGDAAFLNDLAWTISLALFVTILVASHNESMAALLLAWGGSGCVGGLLGIFQSRSHPSPRRTPWWFRRQRDLVPRFLGEFGVSTLATQLTVFAIGGIAGLTVVGAIRAGQLLLGPLNVIYTGVGLVAVPEAARALVRSQAKLQRLCATWSLALAACALGVGAVAAIVPDRLGEALLGQNWPSAQSVIVPLSVWMAGFGVVMGASVGLRALAAARLSLRARVRVAPVMVAAAVGGAALAGAQGAAWGFAGAYAIASIVWWTYFRRGLDEHGREHPDVNVSVQDAPAPHGAA
jgi:O-antigen/teichoic acid export membrane protein